MVFLNGSITSYINRGNIVCHLLLCEFVYCINGQLPSVDCVGTRIGVVR